MAHGAGGKATSTLVEGLIAPAFGLETLADAAAIDGLALTTDSFVVKPLRFPGGSIGELAVNATVNDLAMEPARPLRLHLALILAARPRGARAQPRADPRGGTRGRGAARRGRRDGARGRGGGRAHRGRRHEGCR